MKFGRGDIMARAVIDTKIGSNVFACHEHPTSRVFAGPFSLECARRFYSSSHASTTFFLSLDSGLGTYSTRFKRLRISTRPWHNVHLHKPLYKYKDKTGMYIGINESMIVPREKNA